MLDIILIIVFVLLLLLYTIRYSYNIEIREEKIPLRHIFLFCLVTLQAELLLSFLCRHIRSFFTGQFWENYTPGKKKRYQTTIRSVGILIYNRMTINLRHTKTTSTDWLTLQSEIIPSLSMQFVKVYVQTPKGEDTSRDTKKELRKKQRKMSI